MKADSSLVPFPYCKRREAGRGPGNEAKQIVHCWKDGKVDSKAKSDFSIKQTPSCLRVG